MYFYRIDKLKESVLIMAKLELNKDLSDEEAEEIVHFLSTLTGELPEPLKE